jgi:large subunit ribosomal protein L13
MFAPNADVGDFVIIINAGKIKFTGKKAEQKNYYRHSGYPGGLRTSSLSKVLEETPERALQHAVKGMLPKNRLNARMMKRLRVFTGSEAPSMKAKSPKTEKPAKTENTAEAK